MLAVNCKSCRRVKLIMIPEAPFTDGPGTKEKTKVELVHSSEYPAHTEFYVA